MSDVKLALRESKEQLLKMIIEGQEDPMQHLQNLSFSQASVHSRGNDINLAVRATDTPNSDKNSANSKRGSTGANQHAAYLDISGIHSTD